MQQTAHDVVILGTGLAGLRAAVEICIRTRGTADIAIVSKVQVMRSHSVCAEGGTAAVMRPEEGDSFDLHAWDTVKGSDFLADQDVVDRFVQGLARRDPPAGALGSPVVAARGRPHHAEAFRRPFVSACVHGGRQDRLLRDAGPLRYPGQVQQLQTLR